MTDLAPHVVHDACRSCHASPPVDVHRFGPAPIADRLVDSEGSADPAAPLTLSQCVGCGLAQLRESVEPAFLYNEAYPYFSSVSPALIRHFHASAEQIIAERQLGPGSLVVEAASNDGYMLTRFQSHGIPVLGIDPSDGPVAVARSRGIETEHAFFTAELADSLASNGHKADVFLANNVLAHAADVNDFVAGISALLAADGIAVLEFPYLLDLIDHFAFDTIYHQHLLYISLDAIRPLFERHGLYLNDATRIPIHGGSVRIRVSRTPGTSEALAEMLRNEAARGVRSPPIWSPLTQRMTALRSQLRSIIDAYRARGARIAAYGAAAKATTLMHALAVTETDIEFIVDRNPHKHGRHMPGTHIPIRDPGALSREPIDLVIILAWNFANEIMAETSHIPERGGEFLIPLPDLVVTRGQPMRAAL